MFDEVWSMKASRGQSENRSGDSEISENVSTGSISQGPGHSKNTLVQRQSDEKRTVIV